MKRRRGAPPDPDQPRSDSGPLAPDERALWHHVARSVAPIATKARERRVAPRLEADDGALPDRRPAIAKVSDAASAQATPAAARTEGKVRAAPPLADFDSRKAKKIGSGRAGIEARLDLHGLRQDEALGRLRGFLRDCHARGLKTVLVITGKGRDADDPSTPYGDTLDRPARGVLRRNLPRWLDEPEVRSLVVSYTTAGPRHGGDGAFYVELRKRT